MILLHRLTPFAIGLAVALGFASLLRDWTGPFTALVATSAAVMLLCARLLRFHLRTFAFWNLLGTPVLYLLATFGLLLLMENPLFALLLAIVCILLVTLFYEYVFQYIHLPARYQPFSIEYLSLLLNVLTVFSLSSVAYGLLLLVQAPLFLLSLLFLLLAFFILYGTLIVSKAEESRARPYALSGAVLTTEVFVALAFLPSGLYTNAVLITLFFYFFLGLTRARVIGKLSASVLRRYLIVAAVLLLIVLASTNWF